MYIEAIVSDTTSQKKADVINGLSNFPFLLKFSEYWRRTCSSYTDLKQLSNLPAAIVFAHKRPGCEGSECAWWLDCLVADQRQKYYWGYIKQNFSSAVRHSTVWIDTPWEIQACFPIIPARIFVLLEKTQGGPQGKKRLNVRHRTIGANSMRTKTETKKKQ